MMATPLCVTQTMMIPNPPLRGIHVLYSLTTTTTTMPPPPLGHTCDPDYDEDTSVKGSSSGDDSGANGNSESVTVDDAAVNKCSFSVLSSTQCLSFVIHSVIGITISDLRS